MSIVMVSSIFFLQQITSVTTKVKGQRFPGDQPDWMIFSTFISGRLLCGIFRRNFCIYTVMAVNPWKLKYLGWDFLSIQWVGSDISGEIFPLYIERIQTSRKWLSLHALSRLKLLHILVSWYFACIYQ